MFNLVKKNVYQRVLMHSSLIFIGCIPCVYLSIIIPHSLLTLEHVIRECASRGEGQGAAPASGDRRLFGGLGALGE